MRLHVTIINHLQIANCVVAMLFQCEAFHCHRAILWREGLESVPVTLQPELYNMSDNKKAVLVFSGLKCHFVIEWMDLYIKLLHLCRNMHSAQANLKKQ